ncbi:phospholipid-binding protein MlaC [Thermodesulfobacteriota bacterium]
MKRIIFVLFIILLALPSWSHGAQPLDLLKSSIDNVIGILGDPRYKDASLKDTQQKRIWDIIQQIFDFEEMAKRALARNWRSFTAQQKKDFSEVFGRFLGKNYLDKIQSGFEGEKIAYLGQEMVDDKKAMIRTKIIRRSTEIPVYYSMLMQNNSWKVYDVKVEGVSLMKNYRAQFGSILLKESPDQLIDRLKRKTEEQG